MSINFVRTLWGVHTSQYDEGWTTPSVRRRFVDDCIALETANEYQVPCTVFVYGTQNYENLTNNKKIPNITPILVDERPFLFDLQTEFWRNKLELLRYAMEEYGFEKIVYLDWDCNLIKPYDEKIFKDNLDKKDIIQANLLQYRRRKCKWRDVDVCKTSNGGFIYMGRPDIPSRLIQAWDQIEYNDVKFWDEVAISKLTDDLMGGWKGIEAYWDRFEPEVCNLKKKSPYEVELLKKKNFYFLHYIQSKNNRKSKEVVSGYE